MNRTLPRLMLAPAVVTLFLWMIVPLLMTLYFSTVRYNLMQPGDKDFIGLANFEFFITDPDFSASVINTLLLLGSVIAITVVLGIALALLVIFFVFSGPALAFVQAIANGICTLVAGGRCI